MKSFSKMTVEFILIVVGILVALAIDSEVRQRDDERMRDIYLARIKDAMEVDQQSIQDNIEFFKDVREFSLEFLNWLESDQAVNEEILLAAFWAAEIWPFEPDKSTYEDLKSTGNFRLFDNIDFRKDLAAYYIKIEAAAPYIELSTDFRKVIRGTIPNDIQIQIGACPTTDDKDQKPTGFPPCDLQSIDYAELTGLFEPLRRDEHFRRLLVYRISELRVKNYLLDTQSKYADDVLKHLAKL